MYAIPLNTSLVAIVTTSGNSFSFEAITPLSVPISSPSTMHTGHTTHTGSVVSSMMMAATQPQTAI